MKDRHVVYNIFGIKYRIVVLINYAFRVIYIRFLFLVTHAQYDKIVDQTIELHQK